ncbi:MAG: GNAT family N-acetyltransferase [Paracoccus sp. (in: a-proteobacteria)]
MTATNTLRLVAFEAGHLPDAHRLSQQADWPHRIQDWALNLSVSKGVVAIEGDRIVGTALCSPFGEVATLNMIIVDESMRGRGLGRALMTEVIAIAGDREMRLIATADGLPLYEKLGFKATGQILQHQGIACAATLELSVRIGNADDLRDRLRADHAATGCTRDQLLQKIAAEGDLLLTDGGFALLRKFGRGHVIGPIVAPDDAEARALLAFAAARCAGSFLRVDLRDGQGLGDFPAVLGLAHVGGGIAMTKNQQTTPPTSYALVSQALG